MHICAVLLTGKKLKIKLGRGLPGIIPLSLEDDPEQPSLDQYDTYSHFVGFNGVVIGTQKKSRVNALN